jgi:hypothetical protein
MKKKKKKPNGYFAAKIKKPIPWAAISTTSGGRTSITRNLTTKYCKVSFRLGGWLIMKMWIIPAPSARVRRQRKLDVVRIPFKNSIVSERRLPGHLHIHNGRILEAPLLKPYACSHCMAIYHADRYQEQPDPFALLYMVESEHNHPPGLRVSAAAPEMDNMDRLVRSLPSHQRPTLKRIKQGRPWRFPSIFLIFTPPLVAPLAKALAKSKGMSIEQMLGPNANTARFNKHVQCMSSLPINWFGWAIKILVAPELQFAHTLDGLGMMFIRLL